MRSKEIALNWIKNHAQWAQSTQYVLEHINPMAISHEQFGYYIWIFLEILNTGGVERYPEGEEPYP